MTYESPPTRLGLGIGLTLFSGLLLTIASSLVWMFQGRFLTVQIVFLQNLVSLICTLPLALRKGHRPLRTQHFPLHLLRDVAGVSSYYLFFLAIRFLNLPEATTLYNASPFFVPLVWWIWHQEKIAPHLWSSIVIGFLGVAIMLRPSQEMFQFGFVFGLFSAIASAIALCALRVLNLKKEPMSRTLFYYFAVGSLLTFPFAAAAWEMPTPTEWAAAIGIGTATAIGQMLLTTAYRYGTASYLSPLGYITIIYSALIAWWFLGQAFTIRSSLGALLIVIGGTLTYVMKKKPTSLAQTFEAPHPKEKPPL